MADAAAELRVYPVHRRGAIQAGELAGLRFGRRLMVDRQEVGEWVEVRRMRPPAPGRGRFHLELPR